jgi:hypothetical protein
MNCVFEVGCPVAFQFIITQVTVGRTKSECVCVCVCVVHVCVYVCVCTGATCLDILTCRRQAKYICA